MAKESREDYSLHDDVLDRGTMFAVLFYGLMTAFALTLLGGLLQASVEADLFTLGYTLLFGGLFVYVFREKNIYALIAVAALPVYTLLLGLFIHSIPPINAASKGVWGTYLIVSAAALLIGVMPAYLLRETAPDIFQYLGAAVYGSSVILVTAGITQAVFGAIPSLVGEQSSPRIVLQDGGFSAVAAGPVDLSLVFGLILILFNIPFIAYAREMDGFDPRHLALYLLPLLLYAVILFFTASLLQALAP